jgi:uncharacterized protein (TIGR00730 family)
MTASPTAPPPRDVKSVCLFCGASNGADPAYLMAATAFGRTLAAEGVRLVYGGGGIGLMGAAARAAHGAGGKVLGIIPEFLSTREVVYDAVETVVVRNMHERKRIMFEQSDAFAVFPGGIGTLEEVVELLSWRRLDLHAKPIVFLNVNRFWDPFFALVEHTIDQGLTPAWVPGSWGTANTVDEILPLVRRMASVGSGDDGEVAEKA